MASNSDHPVILVSGLPRSGTSMMMRMLEAGGVPVLTDGTRTADADNPRGYYELEAVKKTKQDANWLESAPDKAVKVIYKLLPDMPPGFSYRVLFMRRRLHEVLASQDAMLRRSKQDLPPMTDAAFEKIFGREVDRSLAWLASQSNFSVLQVDYNRMLEDPSRELAAVDAFLGGKLDVRAMMAIVESSLYRQR